MTKIIGKVTAIERVPTTIDDFHFWTDKHLILSPFDVVKVEHINSSFTYGVIEEISHITDTPSYLTSFISNDFGIVDYIPPTERLGMNYVKAKVVHNDKNIYNPVLDGKKVFLASETDVKKALGLENVKNKMACGYLQMYAGEDKIEIPVYFNSNFVIGPEGAHLNISGISGLASKTSYTMFLIKALQQKYIKKEEINNNDSIAFVIFNVKGKDLLSIDKSNEDLLETDRKVYENLGIDSEPFENVKYFYPYHQRDKGSFVPETIFEEQLAKKTAFKYKYIYSEDKSNLDLLFANIDDSTGTMDSIINFVLNGQGNFGSIDTWETFKSEIDAYCQTGSNRADKEITVTSWRKFKRVLNKALYNDIFAQRIIENKQEVSLKKSIQQIKKNEILVVDIANLDEDTQGFVFGDVARAIYDLKLGQTDRLDNEIPSKIVIFIDELNKYASTDVPKSSPILRQIIDITERGRSMGIVLFSAEQFKSAIHDRVKGNCATHAYGRTNAIEISKPDYRFVPKVYQNMMTRLEQGEYIIQNPVFRSMLNIRFPKPVYNQFKS
ncbi:MAG: hypothetical protein NW226_15320 [Microscillaceae bacterium]|nr:hypothetical protein [Microscillaceae bacterium]